MQASSIEIRPEVAIYAAFRRLNYKAWFALAEFLDNSVQSFRLNKDALRRVNGPGYKLRIAVRISPDEIEIADNAAGIALSDFPRAFLPASPPPDTSGLSEFGLGMKAAACWFSKQWEVRTIALGETIERSVHFNIPNIVAERRHALPISERPAHSSAHGTRILMRDLNVIPQTKTITKIRAHLSNIYRKFIQSDDIEIRLDDMPLTWVRPEFMEAPFFQEPQGESRRWMREFSIDLDSEHRVHGWAGLLKRASVANAGFAVFRRDRLIEGSEGEAFRPATIFRGSNSYTYQRLIGELNVEGFGVSHTKDGIQWADWEDDVLQWLKAELNSGSLKLLDQAEGYRARSRGTTDRSSARTADEVVAAVGQVVVQEVPPLIDAQLAAPSDEATLPSTLTTSATGALREIALELDHAGVVWRVSIELVNEPDWNWLEIASHSVTSEPRELRIRVNVGHPFMVRVLSPDRAELEGYVRLAAGLAFAEVTARAVGVAHAGTVRRNLNELLREALSRPTVTGLGENGGSS